MIMSGNDRTFHLQFPTDQMENNFHVGGIHKGFRSSTSINLSWDPIDSAVGYMVQQDGSDLVATTEPQYNVTGLVPDTEYRFNIAYSTDGTTYLPKKYYTTVYVTSDTDHFFPVLPSLTDDVLISSTCGFVDPYTAEDLYMNVGHNVYKYNIASGVRTLLGDLRLTGVGNAQSRQLSNKRVYHVVNGQTVFMDAGIELANRINSGNISAYLNDPAFVIFDHALVSSPTNTASLVSFTASLDGNFIYYSTTDEDIWKYDAGANVSTLIYAGEGSANTRGLTLDPLDQNSMAFFDNAILKHINLTTLDVTDVRSAMSIAHSIELLGGVIYGIRWHASFFKIDIDGNNYEDLLKPGINFNGLVLDTINKRVILFEGIGTLSSIKVYNIPTIADLPDDPSVFVVVPRPISLDMSWQAIDGATGYAVRYMVGESGTLLSSTEFTDKTKHPVRNLEPGTTYTVFLYYSTNTATPNLLVGSTTKSTLPNLASNYDSSSFENDAADGGFDLTTLGSQSLEILSEVLNEVFSTGALIEFPIGSGSTKAKFVKRGGTTSVENEESIAIPFDTSSGSGQTVSLTLSDSSTVGVTYDESTDELAIAGVTYSAGQSLVLDGKKVTIFNV